MMHRALAIAVIVVAATALVVALAFFTPKQAAITRPDQVAVGIASLIFVTSLAILRFRPSWRAWRRRRSNRR